MNGLRVAIIGGGVCGLGIAWKLAKAGASVNLYDMGEPGRGATWASAGMLAPQLELRPEEEHITLLGRKSVARWPAFVRELEADASMSVGYRDNGILHVALDRDATEQLRFLYEHQKELALDVTWLTAAEARVREPHLGTSIVAGLHAADDHQVDARELSDALVQACKTMNVTIHSYTSADGPLIDEGHVYGVQAGGDVVGADVVVVAAGAWSGRLTGLPDDLVPPVRPVKGQMLSVEQPNPPVLRNCLWATHANRFVYLVPKSDGSLLVGATVEEVGFDTHVTAGGMLDLLRPAYEVLPGLYDLPISESWAGLRPGSLDGAPILGKTRIDGLYMATGHYRNGILFAPITIEDVSEAILTGEVSADIAVFGIDRFSRKAEG